MGRHAGLLANVLAVAHDLGRQGDVQRQLHADAKIDKCIIADDPVICGVALSFVQPVHQKIHLFHIGDVFLPAVFGTTGQHDHTVKSKTTRLL